MNKNKDILTIGFALFAMFFGAGNLLLPPFIGLQIGDHILITIIAFGLTGIILPFLGVLSVTQSGDSIYDLGKRVHPIITPILGTIIMLCIGPLIAIPRTAATTFEVGILPNFPSVSPVLSSIIFFAITWALTIKPSKVVDIIGNLLTPLLLIILFLLIAVGVANPTAGFSNTALTTTESFKLGFTEGYQTVDMLASLIFAGIIISAAKAKGYTKWKDKNTIVIAAGILSSIFLFIIYGGLVYLGSVSGIENQNISRSALLIHIAKSTLGDYGMLAISICIALACLTTAIALVSAVGTFFSTLTNNKLSYTVLVTVCCVFSAILAISGVDNIIKYAYPPLAFVYPIAITLVIYLVIFGSLIKTKAPYIGALIASSIVAFFSLLNMLEILNADQVTLLNKLPLSEVDLGWVVPSIIGFVIGIILSKTNTKTA